jgi:plastocyanin
MRISMTIALGAIACSAPAATTPKPAEPKSEPCFYDCKKSTAPDAPIVKGTGPSAEKAQALREAADQLDKADTALANGNRNLAEQLFSSAELLVGVDTLAAIAPRFRQGGPPRITTPTVKVDPAPPQPKANGSSEADDEIAKVPPPPVEGSLTGVLQIDGKTPSNTFGLITLEPASGTWKPRTPKHIVVEQRDREFRPHVLAVSVGSTVSFPNFDTTFHNVFSTSPVGPFDLGLYKNHEAREVTFSKEGIVRVGCNLHANMSAFIAVVAAPAYVVTDDTGHFAFRHVAPGSYKLKAWSERSKAPIEQPLSIRAGRNDVTVGVAADAPTGPLPDKFGGKR